MWRVIALLVLLVSQATPPAQATQSVGQPYRTHFGNRLATQVMVDGQGPFPFIIDTASSSSLIYEPLRKKLGLNRSRPDDITVYGLNASTKAMPVQPQTLTVAGEEFRNLTLGVLPPGPASAAGVDGILGIDILSRYFVVLDRDTMRLMLLAPDSEMAQSYRDRGWSSVALIPHPLKGVSVDFWYMTTEIDWTRPDNPYNTPLFNTASFGLTHLNARSGPARFTALLDLGAGLNIMNWAAAARMGVHEHDFRLSRKLQDAVRDILGSDEPAIKMTDLTISLSSRRWDNQGFLVANSTVFTYFNLDGGPAAILGSSLLHNNSLAIDFANHRLFIGPTVVQPPVGETADAEKDSP